MQVASAGGTVTVTRGGGATIGWSTSLSCVPDTSYPPLADNVKADWISSGYYVGVSTKTFPKVIQVGTFNFNCVVPASVPGCDGTTNNSALQGVCWDRAVLTVNDCGSGTVWDSASNTCMPQNCTSGQYVTIGCTQGSPVAGGVYTQLCNNGYAPSSGGTCTLSSCGAGMTLSGGTCVCSNGANNPTACNTCEDKHWDTNTNSCVACQNGGCTGLSDAGRPGSCVNGTNNPPACSQCPNGQYYNVSTGYCTVCGNGGCTGTGCTVSNPICSTITCSNGANNPPSCSTCPAGQNKISNVCVIPSVTFTGTPYTCEIAQGNSSCVLPISWTANNVMGITLSDFSTYDPNHVYAVYNGSGSNTYSTGGGVTVPYSQGTYYLIDRSSTGAGTGVTVANVTITANCAPGSSYRGNKCQRNSCTNGGTTSSNCTQCQNGQYYDTSTSMCSNCLNGGCSGTGCTTSNPICSTISCNNGANNPPTCSQCPTGQYYDVSTSLCTSCGGQGGCTGTGCTINNPICSTLRCANGSLNPPTCSNAPNIHSFTINGGSSATVNYNEPATLEYNVTGEDRCLINGIIVSGNTYTITNMTADTTYTLICNNAGGSSSATVQGYVAAGTFTNSVAARSCTIPTDNSTCTMNLSWSTVHMSDLKIKNGTGNTVYTTPAISAGSLVTVHRNTETFSLYNGSYPHDSIILSAGCSGSDTWDNGAGKCVHLSGGLSLPSSSCNINANNNTCPLTLSWNVSSGLPYGGSIVACSDSVCTSNTLARSIGVNVNSGNVSISVPYSPSTGRLYRLIAQQEDGSSVVLDGINAYANCGPGTEWVIADGLCKALLTISAGNVNRYYGENYTLNWTTNADNVEVRYGGALLGTVPAGSDYTVTGLSSRNEPSLSDNSNTLVYSLIAKRNGQLDAMTSLNVGLNYRAHAIFGTPSMNEGNVTLPYSCLSSRGYNLQNNNNNNVLSTQAPSAGTPTDITSNYNCSLTACVADLKLTCLSDTDDTDRYSLDVNGLRAHVSTFSITPSTLDRNSVNNRLVLSWGLTGTDNCYVAVSSDNNTTNMTPAQIAADTAEVTALNNAINANSLLHHVTVSRSRDATGFEPNVLTGVTITSSKVFTMICGDTTKPDPANPGGPEIAGRDGIPDGPYRGDPLAKKSVRLSISSTREQ